MLRIDADAFAAWNECAAELSAPENRARIPELLASGCEALVPASCPMLAIHGKTSRPVRLFDDVPENLRAKHVDAYFDGAYLLDPYYRAGVDGVADGLYRRTDVAPSGFRRSEYFRRYCRDARIIDEIGFITRLGGDHFANLSLVRLDGSPKFRRAEVDRMRFAAPVIHQAIRNYWTAREQPVLHSQLESALARFGECVLTRREAEIMHRFLQGHSTQSIADRLSISRHTVAVHRKNAYAKLDVSSQSELFHLFIDSLTCFDPDSADDPLRRYLGLDKGD